MNGENKGMNRLFFRQYLIYLRIVEDPMKKRVLFIIIGILLVFGGSLFGQEYQLVYNEGDVFVKQGSGWMMINPGDFLPENSMVRVGDGAIAEFASSSETILFSKPGTYQLKSVMQQKQQKHVAGLSSVFSRVAKIGSTGDQGQSQVMGVRAAEAEDEYEFTWVEEDTLSFDEAVAAYNRQEYASAIDIFENEVDPMLLNDEGAYWFYLASSYLNIDRKGPALQIALNHEVNEYSSVFPDFLLLRGRLFLESFDYAQAAAQFEEYIDGVDSPAQLQLGNFLYGYALQQNGDISGGREALNRAVEINADSEVTELARQFL